MRVIFKSFFLKSIPLLVLLLQGCSLDNFSYKLSNSFDYPEEIKRENTIDNLLEKNQSKNSMKNIKEEVLLMRKEKTSNIKKKIIKSKKQEEIKKNESTKVAKYNLKVAKFKPQPYRIIIKLSGANPSAPAERVTKALRQAGIKFEVEKIERFQVGSDTKAFPVNR
tara:strand:- start:7140 stop:7637 length:498 start_codon:yes stop_codon:yes gene_type:complete